MEIPIIFLVSRDFSFRLIRSSCSRRGFFFFFRARNDISNIINSKQFYKFFAYLNITRNIVAIYIIINWNCR